MPEGLRDDLTEALDVWPRNIPQALKDVAGWVMWRWWWDGNRWTKPPYSVEGVKIDEGDPENWTDFSTALQAYQGGGFDGIGISLNAIPELAGADLDHCIQGGKIEPWALEIIEELGSYAEISPSGTGLRILGYGRLRRKGRKRGNIEVYDSGRYLTCTGHRLDGSAFDLVDFDEALDELHRRIWPEAEKESTPHDDECEVGEDLAERFQAFLDDDPIFRERFNTPAAVGDRSDHEFHLCATLWEAGFSEPEIWRLMDSSPQEKWRARDDAYKEGTIREAVRRAIASDRGRGCGATAVDKARVFIEKTVKEALKEDPRKLKDRDVLAALLTLRENDPIEFELFISETKIKSGVIKAALSEAKRQRDDAAAEDGNVYPVRIVDSAKKVLEYGDTIAFLMKQYHRNHRGDETMGKGWFCSFASGQSLTSNGIQPTAHSDDPGMGKTDSGKAAFHCIHTRGELETSVSAMSLYRDKTLRPGDIIFSDDVEWSTALTSTVKRAMSNFQRKTHHTTLDKDNELKRYALPPRLLWWFTSVESSANDQIVDRQFLFDVDNSEDHHRGVNDDIQGLRAAGNLKFDVDDDILTARCITYLIKKAAPFKVLIPYAGFINWKLPRGHRDLNRFLDLIDALAILRYPQRSPKKGEDGATWLTATIEDYKEAKRIFASRQKNIRTHLTDAENRLITVMVERAEWSQADLVDRTGLKQGTVSKRLATLLDKSHYVKSWVDRGENRYATTDKVDLTLFASDVVGLNPPTARSFIGTDSEERYSTIFHIYSYLIPISIPIIINSNRNNSGDIFHKSENTPKDKVRDSDNTNINNNITKMGENVGGIFGERESEKIGINLEKQQQATYLTGNKSGIIKEYDGIALPDGDLVKASAEFFGEARSPTAEEAAVLEDVARKILQNWPGIAEARLWELAREKLGSPLPLAVVKAWLKESGYIDTGQWLNGSPLWNPPVGAVG